MRNVGFVKVERDDEQCMVHIHGKGFRMSGKGSMEIYLIFEEDGKCIGVWQGTEENVDPAINRSFIYTGETVGAPENYEKINGIVLESRNGQRYGAVWDDRAVNLSQMERWKPEDQGQDTEAQEAEREPEKKIDWDERKDEESGSEEMQNEETSQEEEAQEREPGQERMGNEAPGRGKEARERESSQERMGNEAPGRKKEAWERESNQERMGNEAPGGEKEVRERESDQERMGNEEPGGEEEARERESGRREEIEVMSFLQDESLTFPDSRQREICKPRAPWKVRKIQRTELSKLARCEWHLVNNNFLLHGYYNYHHLVLLESREQTLLGVPGIYHEKEGRAAAAFGFAKFVAKDDTGVKLEPEEWNEDYPFGYWCRPVKTMSRWQ